MALTQDEVGRWLTSVAPGVGLTVLSREAGFSRVRLRQQLVGDRVSEETIIKISRVLNLHPLEQLRYFTEYQYLEPSRPDPREIGAFIQWEHLLRACAALEFGESLMEQSLGPTHFGETSRQWIDSIDPEGSLRKYLQIAGPISDPGLSKMLGGPLRLDLALLAAQYTGLPKTSAWVVAQLLTPAEAGWDVSERAQWLQGMERTERLDVVETRIHAALMRERRKQPL
ncbi:hypothetical protein [Paeniglutamicibacter kerguelensis]|uniref:XRE family transcriptional regulator n=1 Tax=Paeniglutamicibacter kerguelensis TaxID=254788 RepID=A0ABS4XIU7_9MICC|nr:hypothetical protein [Paeniglutamicibacter kerguelensis]MBP2388382.1 hypothetical protein [Paeniglutamicibacter kerguelensis]